jgi:ribosomal protein S18 acetylase RimI-like enzyme
VSSEPVRVRPVQPGDLDDLYRICLLTADAGEDATRLYSDPTLPGHIWAAPYAIFEPSLAFVAEDGDGIGGYVVAALNTAAFEQRLEQEWWPGLRARYAEPLAEAGDGMSRAERQARANIHHPWLTSPDLLQSYPSHLHIDLLPRMQGRGGGRRLIETLAAALRSDGSSGLHLFVSDRNKRAQGFYRHVGFTELPVRDAHIFVMDFTRPRPR